MFDQPANDLRTAATLRASVEIDGIGLHTGVSAPLVIAPAEAGSGIRFVRSDLSGARNSRTIPADPALVTKTQLGTVLTNAHGHFISTVEHLMAAFVMLGITDAEVSCGGPEIPILDGSAKLFIEAIERVGVKVLPSAITPIVPKGRVMVAKGGSWAVAEPLPDDCAADIVLDVTIDFEHPSIGTQRIVIEGDRDTIRREVADARTFTLLKDVEALRAMGLALGGSLENAIVVNGHEVVNGDGLRFPNEFVRHKVL
ncbi:MAG: UDP-3-O-acyl-N-acetylglucosamine deacetylase, partial [Parvularcula sp.]|nr:UDP-3-O-acyl-N-acetylglucosamine deacetylase [Parvularcula sp.]